MGLVGVLAGCVFALVVLPASTLAAAAPTSTPAGGAGWIRFGHFVPTEGPVNVTVGNTTLGTNLVFRSVTNYVSVAAGAQTVTVRSATAPATAPPLLVGQADVPSGGAVTAAAVAASDTTAATTQPGPLKLQTYTDDLSAPPAGMAKVRIIHTVPGAPSVNAQLTAATTPGAATEAAANSLAISSVGYGEASPYLTIAAGTYQLTVAASGAAPLVHGQNWPVQAGTVASVVLVSGSTGPTVEVLTDAIGASAAPAGGPQTGFGGTAPKPLSPLVPVAAVAGALLIALALLRRRFMAYAEY